MPIYTASSLAIGSLRVTDAELASRDYNDPQSLAMRGGVEVQGILGMGLFEEVLLTIDYPGSELRVERGALPAPNGRDIVGFSQAGATLAVPVSVGGREVLARLDTGSPAAVTIGGDIAEHLRWRDPPRVVGQGGTVAGAFDIERATLDGEFRLGELTLVDPEVDIVRSFEGVTVGSRVLRRFAMTIDQANDRLRLVVGAQGASAAAGAPTVQRMEGNPPNRRYGLAFAPPQGGQSFITVLDVLSGEVAADAGVRPGDRIVAMNGRPVSQIGPRQLPEFMRGSPLVLDIERAGERLTIEMRLNP
jgi:hypothetical protein